MVAGAARFAVLHPYWTFWEHTAPDGYRSDRLAQVERWVDEVRGDAEITGVYEVASADDGRAVGRALAEQRVDAVVVVQSMAVPPIYALEVLSGVGDLLPLVVWALQEHGTVETGFSHGEITTQGATVGAPMLTNALSRQGRVYTLEVGHAGDPAHLRRVRESVAAAVAAGRIRRARLGRVGRPLDGYMHVDVDPDALREAIGVTLIDIDPAEVLGRYRGVPSSRVRALESEIRTGWDVAEDAAHGEALLRSLRVALALEDIVDEHGLDGGAMNCHVPEIRFADEIGVTPCFGLGRLTSAGIPWTCTGDVVTAVAMLTTRALGGAALYHEIEAIDYRTGEVVIANSGEHDLAWLAPGERPRLVRNGWFCGQDPRCGVCAAIEPAPGPATLVGFTPHPTARHGFRYIVATGELTERRFPETGTANGAFRFGSGPVEEAWLRWADAGVNHHSSASPGDLARSVGLVARHLGVECVAV